MVQCLKKSRLLNNFFFLFLRHPLNIDHLHDTHGAITCSCNEESLPEGSFSQELNFLVSFKLGSFFDLVYVHFYYKRILLYFNLKKILSFTRDASKLEKKFGLIRSCLNFPDQESSSSFIYGQLINQTNLLTMNQIYNT